MEVISENEKKMLSIAELMLDYRASGLGTDIRGGARRWRGKSPRSGVDRVRPYRPGVRRMLRDQAGNGDVGRANRQVIA